jgi:glycosyltransferase involved in cell wall biosynthesis
MDIVVLPSRIEPFGIVAIEAGIMEKPIVTSNVDGLIEIVDDGINGLLFPRGNKQSLFEKLKLLISNPKLRIEFGEKLHQKVSVNFTVYQSIPKYNKIYEMLVN